MTTPALAVDLVLTGERTLPGIPDENYWFRRHEAAYRMITPWVQGARILEAGVGEGYGADLLRRSGSGPVIGLDYDVATARHAAAAYSTIAIVRGDLQRLPIRSGAVDAVVHLQTIEHLHDQAGFVDEIHRVLRPAGTFVISTPNRLTFSPGLDRPRNPFHTRELDPGELRVLLEPRFTVQRMFGVSHGTRLRRLERRLGSLIDHQISTPQDAWPQTVRDAVHRVRANDFEIRATDIDSSLDLVAIAWRRS